MNSFPSPRQFLDRLGRCTPGLAKLVDSIKEHSRPVHLHESFSNDPFQQIKGGGWRFGVQVGSDPTNLLDVFTTIQDIREYAGSEEITAYDQKWQIPLISEYNGPVITLLPDSHIMMYQPMCEFLQSLKKVMGVRYDVLSIVNAEQKQGGVKSIYGEELPRVIKRGQRSLENRCETVTPIMHKRLTTLYDISEGYFGNEFRAMCKLADSSTKEPRELALRFAETRGKKFKPTYVRMVEKTIEKHRKGNSLNYVADKILAATCFAYNLVSQRNKTVVVSGDPDIIVLFELFNDEVLPRYMVKSAFEKIKHRERKKLLQVPGAREKMIATARRQIESAKNEGTNFAVGILYSPSSNRFYVKEVADSIRSMFSSPTDVRIRNDYITNSVASAKKNRVLVS